MAPLFNNRRISDDATMGQDLKSKLRGINKTRTRQFYCLLSSKRLIWTWRREGFSTGSASVLVCRYDWPNSVDRTLSIEHARKARNVDVCAPKQMTSALFPILPQNDN